MPSNIKIVISVVALLVSCAMFLVDHYYLSDSVNSLSKWIALLLGPLMVGAIWVFPEASKKDVGEIRRQNAESSKNQ